MIETQEVVKIKEGKEWQITMRLCESLEEAVDVFGEAGALTFLNNGLKIKKQNIARTMSRVGKTPAAILKAMDEYRPDQARTSNKSKAMHLIIDSADRLQGDAELKSSITDAFMGQDWQVIISLLGEE